MTSPRSLRLFAAVGVAVLGLAALKGVVFVEDLIALVEAPAFASATGETSAHDDGLPMPPATIDKDAEEDKDAPVAAKDASCIVPSFVERAGLSASEIQVLQSLQDRRETLDARESEMETRESLMQAAEARLATRVGELKALKSDVEDLLGQLDAVEEAELKRIVNLYQQMKPKDAARIFASLDADVRLNVAARMKESALASIMSEMPVSDAAALTLRLAKRHDAPERALAEDNAAARSATEG